MAKRKCVKGQAGSDEASKPLLTVREACELLYVHGNTLRRWSDRGIVRAYRVGPRRDRRFKLEDIELLLAEPTLYGRPEEK